MSKTFKIFLDADKVSDCNAPEIKTLIEAIRYSGYAQVPLPNRIITQIMHRTGLSRYVVTGALQSLVQKRLIAVTPQNYGNSLCVNPESFLIQD